MDPLPLPISITCIHVVDSPEKIGPVFMNFKKRYVLPEHLRDGTGLPRSKRERLLVIKRRIEEGYYETERVKLAVAEAFLDPPSFCRAGDQAYPP